MGAVVRRASGDDGARGYRSPVLLHRRSTICVGVSLMEKPNGSNSTVTLLSHVREQTEMGFLTNEGDTRMLLRKRGERFVAIAVEA